MNYNKQHTVFLETYTFKLTLTSKEQNKEIEERNKVETSLASGSLCFTVVDTDHTNLDIFKAKVSGQPVKNLVCIVKASKVGLLIKQ